MRRVQIGGFYRNTFPGEMIGSGVKPQSLRRHRFQFSPSCPPLFSHAQWGRSGVTNTFGDDYWLIVIASTDLVPGLPHYGGCWVLVVGCYVSISVRCTSFHYLIIIINITYHYSMPHCNLIRLNRISYNLGLANSNNGTSYSSMKFSSHDH